MLGTWGPVIYYLYTTLLTGLSVSSLCLVLDAVSADIC